MWIFGCILALLWLLFVCYGEHQTTGYTAVPSCAQR
jgi:hypothetical protein